MSVHNIPFLDLVTPHLELEQELTAVFRQALRTAGFIGGPVVEKFEEDFAAFCDAGHCYCRQQRHRCASLCHHGLRDCSRATSC